ncbi:hypothetical protein FBQ81_12700 [Chloroflexi bacterium CFX6]|nr:hypothetical protein [Chloroflexi bacterium CFX6]
MNEMQMKNSKVARGLFGGIEHTIKQVVKAKQTYKAELAKLGEQKGDFSPDYIEHKNSELQGKYNQARATAYESITKTFEELQTVLEEKNGTLDLENPAWNNALKLIEIGDGLDNETIEKINASFAHDIPALKALQAAYKAKGFTYDGGIGKQVYEIAPSFDELHKTAELVLIRGGGTIGTLARAVGKIAELEGHPFDTSPDPDAFMDAANIGAGLVAAEQ